MSAIARLFMGLLSTLCLGCIGCTVARGRPPAGSEIPLPGQVMDSATLYNQNCAGCHGENGKNGVATSLANPVYLAIAGEATVRKVAANGVPGTLMPAFERSAGGTLTGEQIDSLVQGLFHAWGSADAAVTSNAPSYSPGLKADSTEGQKLFVEFCGHCHGSDGKGAKEPTPNAVPGSIVDPAYLALVTDQSLRSTIVAGRPDQGMPDWRSDISGPGVRAMTDQEITDVVAWLAAQRK